MAMGWLETAKVTEEEVVTWPRFFAPTLAYLDQNASWQTFKMDWVWHVGCAGGRVEGRQGGTGSGGVDLKQASTGALLSP